MSRLFVFIIGIIAGWFLKDSDWKVWLDKLKAYFIAQPTPPDPIPLLEDKNKKTADPLEKLNGIGPVSKKKLNENGVYSFAQVATLKPEKLKEIAGSRVNAKEVIKQAKGLAK